MPIQADLRQFNNFKKVFNTMPKTFLRASCDVLNSQAFYMKQYVIPVEIDRSMTIRNKGFINSSIRVTKAVPRSIENQTAIVGSIYRDRFTGWAEQEGLKSKRERLSTLMARGNTWSKTIISKRRLKASNKVFKKDARQSIPTFLQLMSKNNRDELFLIEEKYKRMKRGIYIITKDDKIKKIIDLSPKSTQPKQDKWMDRSIKAMSKYPLQDAWNYAMDRLLK